MDIDFLTWHQTSIPIVGVIQFFIRYNNPTHEQFGLEKRWRPNAPAVEPVSPTRIMKKDKENEQNENQNESERKRSLVAEAVELGDLREVARNNVEQLLAIRKNRNEAQVERLDKIMYWS